MSPVLRDRISTNETLIPREPLQIEKPPLEEGSYETMFANGRSAERSSAVHGSNDWIANLIGDRQLIVASNRQPYSHETDGTDRITVDCPAGGLTAGLDPVMQRTGGTWVAWGDGDRDFDVVDGDDCVSVPPDDPGYQLKRLRLSEEEIRHYYYGYSNQVLWPLCHSALTQIRCNPGFWRHYRNVNERFAGAVADRAEGRPLVWFQDYHLALAPKLVRSYLPAAAVIMHFWHIPWPSWDAFRACPHRRELLEGLLNNDLIGFHTPRYRTNFLHCVDAAMDGAIVDWQAGSVSYQGRTVSVEAIPMGVPFEEIRGSVTAPTAEAFWPSFAREHDIPAEARIAVGVDRLDYTKGIVKRLRALERLWEVNPGWRGELTYVQNGSESRSRIPAYQEVQEDVADAVDRINDRFGTDDWQPIVYVTDCLEYEELYGLYRHADLALVTPIRDGMNLVAQEYVAAQVDDDGMLVLSDQAGIHDNVAEYAVTVSPHDTEGSADAIAGALIMPPGERRYRMNRLRRWVADHDLDAWLDANLRTAMDVAPSNDRSVPSDWNRNGLRP